MYRCELCGETSKPGEQAYHVITETRDVDYPRRSHSQAPMKRKDRTKRKRWRPDPGGNGAEIVDESLACSECAVRVGRRSAEADATGALPDGMGTLAAMGT